jgi:N-carbamoylputrescine amidase
MSILRVALLHLAPRLGDLAYNCALVETAITSAATWGADWVVTPELCLCGYDFCSCIGTTWIEPPPDTWVQQICRVAARERITVFLSHPERDRDMAMLHNTVLVIAADGTIIGTHRKVHVIPVAEARATPATTVAPVVVAGVHVGILVCADAYTALIARSLQEQGAQLLVSPTAWGPWPHGPGEAWEQRTRETGLPLFVCNRTGTNQSLDFTTAESVVVKDGTRLLPFHSPHSTLILIDRDLQAQELVAHRCLTMELPGAGADESNRRVHA